MYPNFSEFGLYRYESASSRLRNKRNGLYSTAIVYSIIAMAIIFSIILYIFLSNRSIEITNNFANNTKRHLIRNSSFNNSSGLEIIEIAAKNSSETSFHSKRIKRLDSEDEDDEIEDSPEQQKLILNPTRRNHMQSRNLPQRPKNVYTSLPANHKLSPRKIEPRSYAFRQSTFMPKPYQYLKPPTGKSHYNQVNNIQDILKSNHRNYYQPIKTAPQFVHPNHNNQAQMSQLAQFSHNQMQSVPVQLTGKYRHPRTNVELAQIFKQNQGHLQAEGSDPFKNFKPISPYDINQMINQNDDNQQKYLNSLGTDSPSYFRRKYRQKLAKQKDGNLVEDRNEVSQNKPFSVMLDVFPMKEEEEFQQQLQQQQQLMQMQKLSRIRPLMSRYYQDPQFFNTMNFPQLMPRYPTPYFRYQNQPQASVNHGKVESNGIEKPSQLIVHLNLYPKQNSASSYKRSSTEEEEEKLLKKQQQQLLLHEEIRNAKKSTLMKKNQTIDISSTPFNINFNVLAGNAHPENVMYHKIREFNRTSSTSTEASQTQNYFYEDEDDYEFNQSGISVAPSLVYKNIFRDRPIHMMLRNRTAKSTTTTRQPSMIKTNQKFEYQAIKRPKTKYFNYIPKMSTGPFYR
ncbi:hypothetical protein PVAND_012527 [Polypedilum vanderplanki]|uniref:Uncharacterized protein n=1 Tax=Polypedilum vanderplanki TaxID=319348 RepID=A0A9J6CLT1_POLVA|nr:hypothetical protein PVAND_012527 [Polypedilum vanderplanki]